MQTRLRSRCVYAQSGMRLCFFSLSGCTPSQFAIYVKFTILNSLSSRVDHFEPYLIANPEDRFSHDELQSCATVTFPGHVHFV